MKQMKNAKP